MSISCGRAPPDFASPPLLRHQIPTLALFLPNNPTNARAAWGSGQTPAGPPLSVSQCGCHRGPCHGEQSPLPWPPGPDPGRGGSLAETPWGALSPRLRKPTAEQVPSTEGPEPRSEPETQVVTEVRAHARPRQPPNLDALRGAWCFVCSPKRNRIPRPGPGKPP